MSHPNPWNEVARLYDEVRPSYPEQLVSDLVETAELSADSRLLEIGAGTGKATVLLAERGFRVHCIEPGQDLAGILTSKCARYPRVTVDVASFEEWTPRTRSGFDLVLSAQAFNWLDPSIRYRKCHELLRKGGRLALFWYQPSDECPELRDEVNSVISRHAPEALAGGTGGQASDGMVASWESDITSSGLFGYPTVSRHRVESVCSAEAYARNLQSWSKLAAIPDEVRSRINDEVVAVVRRHGGSVRTFLDYTMYVAERL